jgi:alpha-tubulin suppressor-like RCC1 family protein
VTLAPGERFAEASSIFRRAGKPHVCGRTVTKRVRCFHLDAGVTAPSPTLDALAEVRQLAAAEATACALTEPGAVWCWRDARFGQLGGAHRSRPFEAARIPDLRLAVEIAVGGAYACARAAAGEIHCWGSNRDGTAPDGAPGLLSTPVAVLWP